MNIVFSRRIIQNNYAIFAKHLAKLVDFFYSLNYIKKKNDTKPQKYFTMPVPAAAGGGMCGIVAGTGRSRGYSNPQGGY
jgi:hypothetical protein